jgi:hypothetical protein
MTKMRGGGHWSGDQGRTRLPARLLSQGRRSTATVRRAPPRYRLVAPLAFRAQGGPLFAGLPCLPGLGINGSRELRRSMPCLKNRFDQASHSTQSARNTFPSSLTQALRPGRGERAKSEAAWSVASTSADPQSRRRSTESASDTALVPRGPTLRAWAYGQCNPAVRPVRRFGRPPAAIGSTRRQSLAPFRPLMTAWR